MRRDPAAPCPPNRLATRSRLGSAPPFLARRRSPVALFGDISNRTIGGAADDGRACTCGRPVFAARALLTGDECLVHSHLSDVSSNDAAHRAPLWFSHPSEYHCIA